MYHLAVQAATRNWGIASKLVDEPEDRLREKGCFRTYLLVTPDNGEARAFYENRKWKLMDPLVYSKDLI